MLHVSEMGHVSAYWDGACGCVLGRDYPVSLVGPLDFVDSKPDADMTEKELKGDIDDFKGRLKDG